MHIAWSGAFLKTFEYMRKLDFFRLPAPAAMPAHLGAGSLKKSNFLIFSKALRKGADQAICTTILPTYVASLVYLILPSCD